MFTSYLIENYKFKNSYNNFFNKQIDKYDLNNIDINIILFLYNNPALNNAKDIVNLRGLAKSNVSNSLSKLEKRKIVFYSNDSKDKRKINIILNDEFNTMYIELKERQNKFLSLILEGIDDKEKEVLNNATKKMINNLERIED